MKKVSVIGMVLMLSLSVPAQVGISVDTSFTPDSSAILDLKSSDKGLLIPRLTTVQQFQIQNPAISLLIFNLDSMDIHLFDGTYWLGMRDNTDTLDPSTWICGLNINYNGQSYNTVQIGTQCWMAENLNVGTMINGSINQSQQTPEVIEKYCWDNSTSNCHTYGGLYQWDEMMQYVTTEGTQGICPTGWHLSTDAEWCTLENEVDAGTIECSSFRMRGIDAGLNLKTTSGWEKGGSGTDLFGFSGLPGGQRYSTGYFYELGYYSHWWTSTESNNFAWIRCLECNNPGVERRYDYEGCGYSVRCVRDY